MVVFLVTVMCLSMAGIQALNEPCSVNSDCKQALAECKAGTCQCNAISYSDGSRCLQYTTVYKGYCEHDEQCHKFLGEKSLCKRAECVCNKDHVWYRGKCQPYSGKDGPCNNTHICYDKNDMIALTCISGKCSCSSSYYDRGPDCRRYDWPFRSHCVLNADCVDEKKVCIKGKCSEKPKKEDTSEQLIDNTRFSKNIKQKQVKQVPELITNDEHPSCKIDADCKAIANSKCLVEKNKCGCMEYTYYHNGNCIPGFRPCSADTKCEDKNTMCFEDTTCICKQGFFFKNGECIAELGVPDPNVKSVADCKIRPAEFLDHVCYCANYWFPREDNRYCTKTTTQEFQSCMENSWCDAMGSYSYCDNGKCNCSSFAVLEENIFYCKKISEPDDSVECLRDNDCPVNKYCLAEKCQCLDGFIEGSNGSCLADLGTTCTHNSCYGKYLCIGSICGCDEDYVGVDGHCWKVVDNLNETCVCSEQCRNIRFSDCLQLSPNSTEKTCSCVDGYTDYENSCIQIKSYGDPCMKLSDCTRVINKSLQCRNSICQCPIGQNLHNGYCRSAASSSHISHIGIFIVSIFSICRWIYT